MKPEFLSQTEQYTVKDFDNALEFMTESLSKGWSLDASFFEAKIASLPNRGKLGTADGALKSLSFNVDAYSDQLYSLKKTYVSTGSKINLAGLDIDQPMEGSKAITTKLVVGMARAKAILNEESGLPIATHTVPRAELNLVLDQLKQAAKLYYQDPSVRSLNFDALIEESINRSNPKWGRLGNVIVASPLIAACVAANPTEVGSFDPAIINEPPALVEAAIPETKMPTPEPEAVRSQIESTEYSGADLESRIKEYSISVIHSYDSTGNAITLEGVERPTAKAAFKIGQDEFILGFGVNNTISLMMKDGERYVETELEKVLGPTGQPLENMYAYFIYLDPDTKQITDNIDDGSLRIPILTQINAFGLNPGKLIYLDWHDPSLSQDDFYDVVGKNEKGDGLLSIVTPNLLLDITSAPKFVKEINFEGDWKVVFDDDGNTVIIDVASGEELGDHLEGDWVPTPEQVWKQEAKDWKIDLNNVTEKRDVDGNIVIVDNTTKEIIYWKDSWALTKARELVLSNGKCKVTNWVGVKDRSMASTNEPDRFNDVFFYPMMLRAQAELRKLKESSMFFAYDFLGGEGNCWATEPVDGVGMRADHMDKTRIFWIDTSGVLKNESVFVEKNNNIVIND